MDAQTRFEEGLKIGIEYAGLIQYFKQNAARGYNSRFHRLEKRFPDSALRVERVDRNLLDNFQEEAEGKYRRCLEIEQAHPEIKDLVEGSGSNAYQWLQRRIEELHREAVSKRIAEGKANFIWIDRNLDELRKEFSEQFVAVEGQKIVDHDIDGKALCKRVSDRNAQTHSVITVGYVSAEDYPVAQ